MTEFEDGLWALDFKVSQDKTMFSPQVGTGNRNDDRGSVNQFRFGWDSGNWNWLMQCKRPGPFSGSSSR